MKISELIKSLEDNSILAYYYFKRIENDRNTI